MKEYCNITGRGQKIGKVALAVFLALMFLAPPVEADVFDDLADSAADALTEYIVGEVIDYAVKSIEESRQEELRKEEAARKAEEERKRIEAERIRREQARRNSIRNFAVAKMNNAIQAYDSIDTITAKVEQLRATMAAFDFDPGKDSDYVEAKRICDGLARDKTALWSAIEDAYLADQRLQVLPDNEACIQEKNSTFAECNRLATKILSDIDKLKEGV